MIRLPVLVALMLMVGRSSAEPLSVDSVLHISDLRQVTISMDGSKLAMIRRVDKDDYSLLVLDVDQDYKVLQLLQENSSDKLLEVTWLSEDRFALAIQKSKMLGWGRARYNRLAIMNADGSGAVGALTNHPGIRNNNDLTQIASVLWGKPDSILLFANDPYLSLYKVDIESGDAERVVEGRRNTVYWSVDDNGNPILRFDYDTASGDIQVFAQEAGASEWKKIVDRNSTDEEIEAALLGGSGEDEEILMLHRKDDDDYYSLYQYDPVNDSFGEKIFAVDGLDLVEVIKTGVTGTVIGVKYVDDYVRYHYFSEGLQAVQAQLENIFPMSEVALLDASEWLDRFLVLVSNSKHPGVYYLYDRWTEKATRLGELIPGLEEATTTVTERISYESIDGLTIHGYLTYPNQADVSSLPLIVHPHDGPARRDSADFDPFVQFWASRGYVVFQPNFRGSVGYGKSFREAGRRQWGLGMVSDIAAGVHAIGTARKADISRVCAVGVGFGGYISLMLEASTNLLDCVVSIDAYTDLPGWLESRISNASQENIDRIRESTAELVGDYERDRDFLRSQSPIYLVDKFSAPVLLMHRDSNTYVPERHSKQLHKALRKAGVDSEYQKIKTSRLKNRPLKPAEIVLKKTEKFFARHLTK